MTSNNKQLKISYNKQLKTSYIHQPNSALFKKLSILVTFCAFLHACGTLQDEMDSTEISAESSTATAAQTRTAISRTTLPDNAELYPLVFDDVWERIRLGFVFTSEHENEKILSELAFYADNQGYLNQVSQRAAPFLFDIVEEIEKRDLPMELALLPIIESAFDPTATSPANAVGLWQFMSATGRSLGLKQDWWYDARRDPQTSTIAALDYLESLYARFDNDWLLALAAYNAGQGSVQRAIQHNLSRGLPVDFWSLPLPRETLGHVPRLIGLARLVADPARYDIELSPIANEQSLTPIDIGRQIDLTMAAQLAGLEPEVIYQLNPGYKQWATHPDGPHTLMLPISHAEQFNEALKDLPANRAVTWDRYVVRSGDTLGAIARQFRTQVDVLQEVNGLKNSRIIAGESLLIPRAYNSTTPVTAPDAPVFLSKVVQPTATESSGTYTVRRGDTLWEIARRYNVSLSDLTSWNNIRTSSILRPGQELIIHLPQIN